MKSEGLVVYNTGTVPVFISRNVKPDPAGGPGQAEQVFCIEPGRGIDLAIVDLSQKNPGIYQSPEDRKLVESLFDAMAKVKLEGDHSIPEGEFHFVDPRTGQRMIVSIRGND